MKIIVDVGLIKPEKLGGRRYKSTFNRAFYTQSLCLRPVKFA
jgi:hypothetical protein